MSKNTQLGNLVNGVYVDSTGKVGVGTQSPAFANSRSGLTVRGNANGAELLVQSTTATDGTSDGFVISAVASDTYLYNRLNGFVAIATNNVERMRITAVGNVGIGTSSPEAYTNFNTLTVDGTSGSILAMRTNGTLNYRIGTNSGEAYLLTTTALPLVFYTNTTERMRILSNGNIGVGTGSPTSLGTGYTTVDIRGTSGGGLNFGTTNAIGFIYADGGALDLGTYSTQIVRIYQSSSLRFMVASNGNILIGTQTDNGYKLNVSGNIYSSSNIYALGGIGSQSNITIDYGYVFAINSNTQASGNCWYMQVSSSFSNNFRFFYGGTSIGYGSAKFQIDTGGGYTGLSDINKKKDIASSALGLAEVMQLKPSTFKFKDDENQEEQIGFIAQEVKDIIPQAYYEDKEGDDKFIGLKQAAFIPVLVKAIQELKAEIETLKHK
jgi:hypothetical protein